MPWGLALWAWWPDAWGFAWPKVVLLCLLLAWHSPRSAASRAVWLAGLLTAVACFSRVPRVSFMGIPGEWSACVLSAWVLVGLTGVQPGERWYRYVAVALSVHAIWQRFLPDGWWVILPQGRSSAWIGSPVDLGALLAMGLPLSGWLFPVVLAGLAATGSRAAILGGLLGGACQLLKGRWRWLFLLACPLAFLAPLCLHQPKDQSRWQLWQAATQDLREHPLGTGPGTFLLTVRQKGITPDQTHPHNDLLEAATGGWPLLIGWLMFSLPLYAYPPLLALLLVLKFDPVSFEVLAMAALLTGNVLEQRWWRWSSLAAGALAATVLAQLYPLR